MSEIERALAEMPVEGEIIEGEYSLSTEPGSNPSYILINEDRTLTVPESLKQIAIQGDHNVETIVFKCPRYNDGVDLSQMTIYINYTCPNVTQPRRSACTIIRNKETGSPLITDDGYFKFEWSIHNSITNYPGTIRIVVSMLTIEDRVNSDESTTQVITKQWHSAINNDLFIGAGIPVTEEEIISQNESIIDSLLSKMNDLEEIGLSHTVDVTELDDGYQLLLKDSTGEKTVHIKHGGKGETGAPGKDGDTPTIINGEWYIGGKPTGYSTTDYSNNLQAGEGENSVVQTVSDEEDANHAKGKRSAVIAAHQSAAYQKDSFASGSGNEAGMTEEEFNAYYWDSVNNIPLHGGQGKNADGEIVDAYGKTYDESYGQAFVIGNGNKGRGKASFTAGIGNINDNPYCTQVGTYNELKENTIFQVGFGGPNARKTAFWVDKDGNVYTLKKASNPDSVVTQKDLPVVVASPSTTSDMKSNQIPAYQSGGNINTGGVYILTSDKNTYIQLLHNRIRRREQGRVGTVFLPPFVNNLEGTDNPITLATTADIENAVKDIENEVKDIENEVKDIENAVKDIKISVTVEAITGYPGYYKLKM